MQKVISINLNGHAYQLEESGYDTLAAYLAGAERDLASNPDRAEIMADLEQAIADKCRACLGPHKSVVTAPEVARIVAEMGPVDAPDAEAAAGTAPNGAAGQAAPSRLYRIREGSMIAGVCTGLAAYFKIDVTVVRAGFFVTALLSKGAGVFAYVIMMFVVPEATTPEERKAAGEAPFNAKDVVDRATRQASQSAQRLRSSWRRQQRWWSGGAVNAAHAYPASPIAAGMAAAFAVVHFALFFAMIAALVSLVNHEEVLGWELDPEVPVWAAALILLIGYQIAVAPIRAAAAASWARGGAWPGFYSAAIWLVGLAFALWIGSEHLPELREFVRRVPDLFREFLDAVRQLTR